MVPIFLFVIVLNGQLWNRDRAHHRIDGDKEKVTLADFLFLPCGFVHGHCGDFGACRVGACEDHFSSHFKQIALPSRRDEFQRVNGNGNEFSVCEFRTGYAPCLVHDGKQSSTEQRVMVVGITWKNVFNERHRLI